MDNGKNSKQFASYNSSPETNENLYDVLKRIYCSNEGCFKKKIEGSYLGGDIKGFYSNTTSFDYIVKNIYSEVQELCFFYEFDCADGCVDLRNVFELLRMVGECHMTVTKDLLSHVIIPYL